MKLLALALVPLVVCGCKSREDSHREEAPSSTSATLETDAHLAESVRKAIAADMALSYDARNVRVTADDGVVTLRGTVASEDERSRIEALARNCAGVRSVDNEVEVRT